MRNFSEHKIKYFRLRDEYGLLSYYVDELRDLIIQAARHDQLTNAQREELLSLVDSIDQERQALVGSA